MTRMASLLRSFNSIDRFKVPPGGQSAYPCQGWPIYADVKQSVEHQEISEFMRTALCATMLASCLMSAAFSVSADDQDTIDYREHIMDTLGAQTEALGMIMSNSIPNDNAVAHLEVIAGTAQMALKSFEPKVAGGEAKPTVWSDWPDFSKRMNDFAKRTAAVAKLAKEKGFDAVPSADLLDALSCKSCHDVYRDEKKKK